MAVFHNQYSLPRVSRHEKLRETKHLRSLIGRFQNELDHLHGALEVTPHGFGVHGSDFDVSTHCY